MDTVEVTLLLLAYNDETTIVAALESIFNQDLLTEIQSMELIVLPNGCTDKTEKLIDAYLKSKSFPHNVITKVITAKTGNRNRAINTGLKAAQGKLVFYMNGDCTISNGALDAAIKLFNNDEKVKVIGLHDVPLTDHLMPDSLIKGIYETSMAIDEVKKRVVPIGRFIGFRKGLVHSIPEDIHSEDIWFDIVTVDKYGIDSIVVIQDQYVYWRPSADWASYINLYARYQRGTAQLFEAHPEVSVMYQKILTQVKKWKTVDELRGEIINNMVKKGKTHEQAVELFGLYQQMMKVIKEQALIIQEKLIDSKTGKWTADR